MHIAASRGNNGLVELLIDEKANKEVLDNNNQTPLHLAAKYGKTEVVRVLVRKGANKGATDMNDQTPLHLALDRATALILLDPNVSTVSSTVPVRFIRIPSAHNNLSLLFSHSHSHKPQ
jgi:hypothetical protein